MKQLNTINANIVICVLVAPLDMPSDLVNDVLFLDSVQVSVSYPLVFYPSMVARPAQSKNVSGRKRESNEHGDAANQFLYPLKGSFRASRHIAMRRPEKKSTI